MQTNNKLREALEYVQEMFYVDCNGEVHICANEVKRISDKIKDALAAPPRNCDVGTAEEQQARHCAWGRKHGIDGDNKVNCAHPDMSCDLCTLRWSQMPYVEKEGGNDGK